MITKKSFMLVIALMSSTIIFAQKGPGKKHDGEAQAEKMKSELSLNDTQYASIKSINQKYKDKHIAIRKDSTLSKENKMSKMKGLHEEREKEVNAVLTPAQSTKWKTLKKEKTAARKEEHKKEKAERDAKLKSDLSLSDDQFTKLKAANKTFHDKAKNLKKGTDKAEFKKLHDEHDANVKNILSAEQYQKWQTMKADWKGKRKGHKGHGKK